MAPKTEATQPTMKSLLMAMVGKPTLHQVRQRVLGRTVAQVTTLPGPHQPRRQLIGSSSLLTLSAVGQGVLHKVIRPSQAPGMNS